MTAIESIILSDTETTFQYDKDLLTLPVPELDHTLKKYLESVRPHVTDDEYKQTEAIVQQFAIGEGKYLHQKLQEKAKHERNWLEKWWEDVAYLEVRLPAPLMNMAGPGPYHEDVWLPQPGSQIKRAALSLYYILQFWQFIRKEKQKPMKDRKGRPQCMYQFRRIFNTCNIPGVHRDKLIHYFKTESEGSCPSHMMIASKGHLFMLETCDKLGEVLTPPELELQLQKIRDKSLTLGPPQGVTFLTTEERATWARARSHLVALDPQNSKVLDKIQSSIMGIWLEDGNAGDLTDLANKALLGSGENRWLDKSLSSGTYENGLLVSNADHTPAEGMLMVFVTSYVHAKIHDCQGKWQGSTQIRSLPEPELLQFVLDDHLIKAVEAAKKHYDIVRQSATAELRSYKKYGKNYCKKVKIHPDVYCQLAMQLGFYTIYGKMPPTYETAQIKQFYHGRTETMRSCTNESKAWCEAMVNPSVLNAEKYRLLFTAADKHNRDFDEACEFRACDRHLLGLYLIGKEEGRDIPLLYQDPSFIKSGGGGNFLLSTSCIGYTFVSGAVLPMCENGIGTFYRINDDRLVFYITTWNADAATSSPGYADAVCNALDAMQNVIDRQSSASAARL